MYKKTIAYTDYFGEEREETFYFHFSEAELSKMELSRNGGISRFVEKIIQTKDNPKLVDMFEDFILSAYGEKSEDGRRFIKTDELSTAFKQTPAYSILFMQLITDADELARFIKEVVPKELSDRVGENLDDLVKSPDLKLVPEKPVEENVSESK